MIHNKLIRIRTTLSAKQAMYLQRYVIVVPVIEVMYLQGNFFFFFWLLGAQQSRIFFSVGSYVMLVYEQEYKVSLTKMNYVFLQFFKITET